MNLMCCLRIKFYLKNLVNSVGIDGYQCIIKLDMKNDTKNCVILLIGFVERVLETEVVHLK